MKLIDHAPLFLAIVVILLAPRSTSLVDELVSQLKKALAARDNATAMTILESQLIA